MALIQAFLAIAVMQVATSLPSPFKELLLFCVCVGVLWGGALVQQAAREPPEGPAPPEGWAWRPGGEGQPEVLLRGAGRGAGVALVPGNPGVPHYYCQLGEALERAYEAEGLEKPTVYCVGYLNFATQAGGAQARQQAPGSVSVKEEAQAIGEVLEELQASHPDGLVVFGHSIGAWIALQHLKEAKSRPPLLVLAMPYLEYRRWSLQPFLKAPQALGKLVALTATLLPSRLKELLAVVMSQNPRGSLEFEVTLKTFLAQPHQLCSVVGLYRTECAQLDPAKEGQGFSECERILQMPRPPLLAVYTKDDLWAPMEHSRRLQGLLSEKDQIVDLSLDPSMKGLTPPCHSFVLAREHCQLVAGLVAVAVAKKR